MSMTVTYAVRPESDSANSDPPAVEFIIGQESVDIHLRCDERTITVPTDVFVRIGNAIRVAREDREKYGCREGRK